MSPNHVEEIRKIIEDDLAWRLEEIAFMKNLANEISSSAEDRTIFLKKKYRKLLVLVLYSHFEGYFKFAFETYAYAINEENIKIKMVIDELKISSLNEAFNQYDEPNKWISNENTFEKKHRRFINRVNLFNELDKCNSATLVLPISSDFKNSNSVVFTSSNLTADIMGKIMYQLGFDPKLGNDDKEFALLMDSVNAFLGKRNSISHGDIKSRDGILEKEFESFVDLFTKITSRIAPMISSNLLDKLYMKTEYR